MGLMKIWIDADGCPVVDIAVQVAGEFHIPACIVCDTSHYIIREGAETLTVSEGKDAADFAILNRVRKKDIVVTQDYGLAALILAKGGYAIHPKGLIYSETNIDRLLAQRQLAQKMRLAGVRMKGPKKRSPTDDLLFRERLVGLCRTAIAERKDEEGQDPKGR
jgi:uncharacterized protein YaiI (UPF0178 family)